MRRRRSTLYTLQNASDRLTVAKKVMQKKDKAEVATAAHR